MPLPANIAALLKKSEFDPAKVRTEYTVNLPIWQMYLDLYEMDATRLAVYLEKHGDEDQSNYDRRAALAAIFNYVPTVIKMVVNYMFAQQPTFQTNNAQLKSFIDDCDGNHTTMPDFVKRTALPLALVFGWVDTLVQNPATPANMFLTAADDSSPELSPRLFNILPMMRSNWSVQPNDEYNWVRFVDIDNEEENPFAPLSVAGRSYVTISKPYVGLLNDSGISSAFWVRSWKEKDKSEWSHDGGFINCQRSPIVPLFYQRSLDPTRRHTGLSKVAMIAILTKKIIQLLSWTDEDVLANLAVFVFPGTQPRDDDGKAIPVKITPFKILYAGADAKFMPAVIQGEVSHISIKMQLIEAYIREILRLAYLIGASAEAEQITSGVQGVVTRNELFQELRDIAGSLDAYSYGVLALVQTLLTGDEVDLNAIKEIVTIDFFKGPYAYDPLATTIANSQKLIDLFREISPAMVQSVLRQVAQEALYNEDQNREQIFTEIEQWVTADQDVRRQRREALEQGIDVGGAGGAALPGTIAEETGGAVPASGAATAAATAAERTGVR
jgi:hypothetical protein